jgi:hypothetical protein
MATKKAGARAAKVTYDAPTAHNLASSLRRGLAGLVDLKVLSKKQEREVCAELMSLWFGARTLARALVVSRVPERD